MDNLELEDYAAKPPQKSNRNLYIGLAVGAGVIGLLCICLIIVGVVVWQTGLLGRLNIGGSADTAVKAMPADTPMYVGIDLRNFTPEKLDRVLKPFADLLEDETGVSNGDDAMAQIDESLSDYDMTVENDIRPWIGQYAGLGLSNLEFDSYGSLESYDLVISIETLNQAKADAFLEKLRAGLEEDGLDFDETQYKNVTLYVAESDYSDDTVMARSGNLVLFGNSETAIQQAIDAQKGDSLSKNKVYQSLIKQLPSDRLVTVYLSGDQYQDLVDELMGSVGGLYGNTSATPNVPVVWTDMAVSLGIVDAGLRFDTVTAYDAAKLTAAQREMLTALKTAPKSDALFPQDTVLYLTGQRLDQTWLIYRDLLSETGLTSDVDEAMRMLEDQVGLNPDTDFFPYLNGEYAMGLFPSSDGALSMAGIDLGMVLMAKTSDPQVQINAFQDMSSNVEALGLEMDEVSADNMNLFDLSTYGTPMITFGVGHNYLLFGTSQESLQALFAGQPGLDKSETYRQAFKAFPGGLQPVAYIDVAGVANLIPSMYMSELDVYLDPFKTIALATGPFKANSVHQVLIIALDE
jgi:hypothetical protein